jgi:predicted ABC-type ATPase
MAGGHNISTDTIRRRHTLGLKYLSNYWKVCDEGIILDARTRRPLEVVRKDERGMRVIDDDGWSLLMSRIKAAGGVVPTIE